MYRQEYDAVLLAVGSTVARDMQTAAGFGARPGWGMVQREPYIYNICICIYIYTYVYDYVYFDLYIFTYIHILDLYFMFITAFILYSYSY